MSAPRARARGRPGDAARQDQGALHRSSTRPASRVTKVYDTTPGRMLLGEVLPKKPGVKFDLVNQLLTKKNISGLIDAVYRNCGQKETVIFCDRIMGARLLPRVQGRHLVRQGRHADPRHQAEDRRRDACARARVRAAVQRRPDHAAREVQQGGRRLVALHRQDLEGDDGPHLGGADRQGDGPHEADQLGLHDGPLRRPRLGKADAPARRHARPDDQAVGRDHRDADHLELQGRPVGSRVLQLDPRRPQGSRRHRAEDGELGLSDAPSRRRVAGRDHPRRRLRHRRRHQRAGRGRRRHDHRVARPARARPHDAGRRGRCRDQEAHHQARRTDRREARRSDREGAAAGYPHPLGAHLRDDQRRVRQVLRARPRPRHAGQHRRSCRRHRRAVDR